MKRVALIDADSLLYTSLAPKAGWCVSLNSSDKFLTTDSEKAKTVALKNKLELVSPLSIPPTLEEGCATFDKKVAAIKKAMEVADILLFINGDQTGNPKYSVDPHYKANRTIEKPSGYKKLVDYVVGKYNTLVADNKEADDLVVEHYYLQYEQKVSASIASMDKDILRLVPGTHFDYYKDRFQFIETTPHDAARNMAYYVISGDRSDNILGLHGYGEPHFNLDGTIQPSETVKALDGEIDGVVPIDKDYDDLLFFYLKAAWQVYCGALKKLPKVERAAKFKRNCKLLWLPISGEYNILNKVNLNLVCK